MGYEATLARIIHDVCASTLGASVEQVGPEYAAQLETQQTLSGQIAITGKWNGLLTIVCPIALATRMAEAMFGTEPGEVSEAAVGDALGELTSLVGDTFKAQMDGPNRLLLPSVMRGRTPHPEGAVACVLTFAADDLPIQLTLCETAVS